MQAQADQMPGPGGNDEEFDEDQNGDDFDDDEEGPPSADYQTLTSLGPVTSEGSVGHPEGCSPCTFFCFTRRGCNRGADCRFCHLGHQSKLQARRQDWKKQQREKRRTTREKVTTVETGMDHMVRQQQQPVRPHPQAKQFPPGGQNNRSPAGGQNNFVIPGHPYMPMQPGGGNVPMEYQMGYQMAQHNFMRMDNVLHQQHQMQVSHGSAPKAVPVRQPRGAPTSSGQGAPFSYSPDSQSVSIGQHVEIRPQIFDAGASNFRLVGQGPLPQGLFLEMTTGCIHGIPVQEQQKQVSTVEATLANGVQVRTNVELEVLDFTTGGFVIGHISECEPGKFMLLMYVPEGSEL